MSLALGALGVGGHGRVDPTFGSEGQVLNPIRDGGGARAIALQPDGRLVVAGWAIAGSPRPEHSPVHLVVSSGR